MRNASKPRNGALLRICKRKVLHQQKFLAYSYIFNTCRLKIVKGLETWFLAPQPIGIATLLTYTTVRKLTLTITSL